MTSMPRSTGPSPRPLIQELIPYRPGEKYQLYYLFDATGVPRARFMQRILEEASGIVGPDGTQRRGGISLLWESALDEDLLARGQRLLAAMGWRGTAFVEVVRDRRDGVVKLLEINPRLSGSIHLCLAVGPNLAAAACRVALGLPVAAGSVLLQSGDAPGGTCSICSRRGHGASCSIRAICRPTAC